MPKPTIDTAPDNIRRNLQRARQHYSIFPGGQVCQAAGVLEAIKLANTHGFHWPAAAVPTPAHDKLKQLETEGKAYGEERAALSLELDYERRCLVRAQSMERWASEPSAAELAAVAAAERAEQAKAAAVEQRAAEILAADSRAATEKRKAEALKKAEKEFSR